MLPKSSSILALVLDSHTDLSSLAIPHCHHDYHPRLLTPSLPTKVPRWRIMCQKMRYSARNWHVEIGMPCGNTSISYQHWIAPRFTWFLSLFKLSWKTTKCGHRGDNNFVIQWLKRSSRVKSDWKQQQNLIRKRGGQMNSFLLASTEGYKLREPSLPE